MKKNKIKIVGLIILAIIMVGSVLLNIYFAVNNNTEAEPECAYTTEFAEIYMVNCGNIVVEGTPYTICEQKLK